MSIERHSLEAKSREIVDSIFEFQVLFVEWVQHIKTELENDMEDEWGLF